MKKAIGIIVVVVVGIIIAATVDSCNRHGGCGKADSGSGSTR
jgi:predicted small secreted protein